MSEAEAGLSHHPAPARGDVPLAALAIGLVGGPTAWFVQTCAGSSLSGPHGNATAAGIVVAASVLVALLCAAIAWRAYRRTAAEQHGDHSHLLEVGTGRTRFLALWGLMFSVGFAIFAAANGVGLLLLA